MADIKNYHPENTSISSGQVLMRDYSYEEGKLILKEMIDQMCLRMTREKVVTSSIGIGVGYSNGLSLPLVRGTASVNPATNLSARWVPSALEVYERKVDHHYPIRRFYLSCNNLQKDIGFTQLNYFDVTGINLEKEEREQQAMLKIHEKFGKNALFRGMDLEEAATTRERNSQIGGHKSGVKSK